MEKGAPHGLFVNDGSFMERFKQLQQDKDKDKQSAGSKDARPVKLVPATLTPNSSSSKTDLENKAGNAPRKSAAGFSSGKLAFSLKQKSKIASPAVKLGGDEDEDEADDGNLPSDPSTKRQKLDQLDDRPRSSWQSDVAPPPPTDPTVKKVADKLASFVAKNGRQFEDVTRQKNPGDTPFQFLFDKNCADYKYYEYQLTEEEKALSQTKETQSSRSGGTGTSAPRPSYSAQKSSQQHSYYQTPASALYEPADDSSSYQSTSNGRFVDTAPPTSADPIAMMEFFMKKAAREEKMKQPRHSKDEMPPPASLQASGKRGHHMGDYIPLEELEKFMSSCNDLAAQKAAKEAAEKSKIQADNVGHKLLSKMGWKEGEGLGSSKSGISNPIMAGDVKTNNLGVGANTPGEVLPEDDIYEQYKKRMMLGYRHRPNPLNNPRKAYY